MSKREKAKADGFPTRASIERALPDDPGELKRLAAELMVQKAVLEKELDLVKKTRAPSPHNCQTGTRHRLLMHCGPVSRSLCFSSM